MSNEIGDNKLEFDIGHITQSPCRECDSKNRLPGCSKNCQKLGQLQSLLLGCVSCSNRFHDAEPYTFSKLNI